MAINDEKARWSYLAQEARTGRLYLDSAVAAECRDVCNRQIDLYTKLRENLKQIVNVTGLGNFSCADELAKMLGAKAIGGDGDVDAALKEHLEVITLIRDTIQVSVEMYEAQDAANAAEQDKLLD
ncbi:hypothetical protein ACFVMC_14750 [Nocardia sp. NPDC127579]|uniref:hypothetical protein n=1 Tax=Nocardia sp. NPDC127579 TaxID=3345402 RepID=UPI003628D829